MIWGGGPKRRRFLRGWVSEWDWKICYFVLTYTLPFIILVNAHAHFIPFSRHLANLYTETLSLSPQSRILALNIIESAMVSGTSQSRRKDLNALIAAHKITPTPTTTTTSNDSQTSPPPPPPPPADQHDEKEQEGKFFVCDLHSAIPYHSMSKEERTEIWDDGLHLTEKGYERMGEVVGARLAEILNLGS